MKKAIIYAKIDKGESDEMLLDQEERCRRWAAKNDVNVIEVHTERTTKESLEAGRNALFRAIAGLSCRSADYLLVDDTWAIGKDIFAYTAAHMLVKKIRRKAEIVVVNGSFSDDAYVECISKAYEQYTKGIRRVRSHMSLRRKSSKGERVGAPPFGWTIDKGVEGMDPEEVRCLPFIEDEAEQAVLRKMHEYRNKGLSCEHTARMLNTAGYITRRGRWHTTSVYRALRRAGEFRDMRRKEERNND